MSVFTSCRLFPANITTNVRPAPLAAAAVLATFIALTTSARATVINGSFESPRVPRGGFSTFLGGSTAINGWTVVGTGVALIDTGFVDTEINFVAQDGQQWIDLTGPAFNSASNGVTQSISTVAGQIYRVSFFVGSATNNSTIFASTVDLSIDGGSRVSFTNSTAPRGSLNWQLFSADFIATSNLTSITFFNGSAAGNNLSGLDNVSVQLIPTPATAVLLGLGGPLAARRRRR